MLYHWRKKYPEYYDVPNQKHWRQAPTEVPWGQIGGRYERKRQPPVDSRALRGTERQYAGRHFEQPAALAAPQGAGEKGAGQSEGAARPQAEPGTGGTLTARRKRGRHLHVMVTEDELAQIQRRMAEAGITNAGAYMWKMALNGYILHVDLAPVKELVSLQRRCANNLNQVAIHANIFGVYPEEIAGLQQDYEKLWGRVSDVLMELSVLVEK